jgi:hypothetical protein
MAGAAFLGVAGHRQQTAQADGGNEFAFHIVFIDINEAVGSVAFADRSAAEFAEAVSE